MAEAGPRVQGTRFSLAQHTKQALDALQPWKLSCAAVLAQERSEHVLTLGDSWAAGRRVEARHESFPRLNLSPICAAVARGQDMET